MVSLAKIAEREKVLEIGTGKGVLTRELCRVASEVEGYEVDGDNFRATRLAAGSRRLRLHLADAFQAEPRFDVLVSSLPYSKSSIFIEWISKVTYRRAVVLLQEDFVRKVVSSPGERDYRAVSAIAQCSSAVEVRERVPRSAFSPQPRVGSALVSIRPRLRLSDEQIKRIKRLFALRRKTVAAALGGRAPNLGEDLRRRRVYTLTPAEILELVAEMH